MGRPRYLKNDNIEKKNPRTNRKVDSDCGGGYGSPLVAAHSGRTITKEGQQEDPTYSLPKDISSIVKKEGVRSSDVINEYAGWTLADAEDPKIDFIDPTDEACQIYFCRANNHDEKVRNSTNLISKTAEVFFRNYIGQRRPCLVNGHPTCSLQEESSHKPHQSGGEDASWEREGGGEVLGGGWRHITRKTLETIAGDQTVQVETRNALSDSFGKQRSKTNEITMTLKNFFRQSIDAPRSCCEGQNNKKRKTTKDRIENTYKGNGTLRRNQIEMDGEMLYLSTQKNGDCDSSDENQLRECACGPDDVAVIFHPFDSTPCKQLVSEGFIPSRLHIAGNLIPHACNMWIGRSKNGSSSGLHHDYHDNFYILLRGRKRFRLFSPDCAHFMNTFGTIHKVYHNGRISYVGSEARADGVPLDDEVVNGVIADDWSDDEDGNHYEEAVIGMGFDYESDESRGTDLGQYTYACLQESERNRDDFDALTEVNATLIKGGDNFCRSEIVRSNGESVALNANHQSRDCRQCIVDVVAGQSLYIPAGWFHEVTSFSNDNTIRGSKVISLAARDDSNSQFSATAKIDRIKDDNGGDGFDGCHVAINYWYHPPDQLENFRNPYCSNFWREHTAMPP